MRVIVEIDEEIYEHARIKSEDSNDEWNAMRAIANGIPLPANPTNGDVIKAMFPDFCHLKGFTDYKEIVLFELKNLKDWWNAPYKEIKTDEDNKIT